MNRSIALALAIVVVGASGVSVAPYEGLKIVVVAGEDSVNIVRQKTAVQPVVEIRDRNDVPVAGASVVFRLTGKAARFANSGTRLTVTSDGAGRAAVTGMEAVGKGAVQLQVEATYQGEVATTTITQTNFGTLADAAKAGKAPGVSQSAGNGASHAAAHGARTIGLIAGGAAAVAGGVIAKNVLAGPDTPTCQASADDPFTGPQDAFTTAVETYVSCIRSTMPPPCSAFLNAARTAGQAFVDVNNRACACAGRGPGLTIADVDAFLQDAVRTGTLPRGFGTKCAGN